MSIPPHIHIIRQTIAFQYIIAEGNELYLVDCGLKGSYANIFRKIKELGSTPDHLRGIFITHADTDHFGGLNEIREATKARAMTSDLEAAAMRIGSSSRVLTPRGFEKIIYGLTARLFRAAKTEIDQVIKPGDIFPILGGLEVLDTKGHTPGHISFYSRSKGILFAGDSIDLMSGKLRPSKGSNTWNEKLAQESFDFQLSLNPKLILAGHGYKQIGNT